MILLLLHLPLGSVLEKDGVEFTMGDTNVLGNLWNQTKRSEGTEAIHLKDINISVRRNPIK